MDTYLLRGPRMDLNILGLNFKFSNALPGKLYAVGCLIYHLYQLKHKIASDLQGLH